MILLLLIALAARVDASPADDARTATSDGFAEAIRYANILTGDDPDDLTTTDRDDDDHCDDDDCDGDDCDGDDCDGDDCDGDNCDDEDCDEDDREDDDRRPDDRRPDDRRPGDGRPGDGRPGDGRDADGRPGDGRDADGRGADGNDAHDHDDDDDNDNRPNLALAGDEDGASDRSASLEDVSSDLAGAAMAGHLAGELAMLDAGAADSGEVADDDVSFAATSAGAAETYESWMRHQRPSPWGRLDVGVAWRRRWSEPLSGMSRRYDEVLLVATWRR